MFITTYMKIYVLTLGMLPFQKLICYISIYFSFKNDISLMVLWITFFFKTVGLYFLKTIKNNYSSLLHWLYYTYTYWVYFYVIPEILGIRMWLCLQHILYISPHFETFFQERALSSNTLTPWSWQNRIWYLSAVCSLVECVCVFMCLKVSFDVYCGYYLIWSVKNMLIFLIFSIISS